MSDAPRVAVVTGAGQGMGRAVAVRLAQTGALVHLVGRTGEKLERTAAEISAAGGTALVEVVDVSLPGALEPLASRLDRVDILVNCAGESLMATLDETSAEAWQRVIANNLTSCFVATRALLPALRASENGTIILVSSKVALRGYGVVAYSAAKAGVLGFAHALGAELRAERIRVVAICPGPTDTPMRWLATPDMDRGQVMSVDAIADTVQYVVDLPRGTTTGDLVVESVGAD